MKQLIICLLALSCSGAHSAEGQAVRLAAALDAAEGYCLDVPGPLNDLRLDDPLHAHTCKTNSADQLFEIEERRIRLPAYDRCLTAAGSAGATTPDAAVLARPCDQGYVLQHFVLRSDMRIALGNSDLCLEAGAISRPGGRPTHLWRALSLQPCRTLDEARGTWHLVD